MQQRESEAAGTVIALEFVIGVTGHRDCCPADEEALKTQIRSVLAGMKERFDRLPMRVVTGLAEGADTLVTEVALDLGLPVSAVLPMPRQDYEQDFAGEALARFTALADDERVVVHELPVAGEAANGGLDSPEARVVQYQMLMDFLVRRSNALLVLWDGKALEKKGGTSDVVSAFLSGSGKRGSATGIGSEGPAFENCGDLVIWLKTPRASAPGAVKMGEASYLASESSGMVFAEVASIPAQFAARWAGFESYARDRYSEQGRQFPTYPLAEESSNGSSVQAMAINREFQRADQLAMASQRFSDELFRAFALIAAAMGFFFLVYAKLAALGLFLVFYVGLFLVGYSLFKLGARQRWFSKHLSYRALAETMRVQYFMLVSGAGQRFSTRRIVNLTSVDRFKGFEWLQDAVRCMEPLTFERHVADGKRLELVHKHWIGEQCSYFSRKLAVLHRKHERLEVIKASLLLGSVLGALALILFKYSLYETHIAGYDGKTWLVFLMGLLPLWLAVWELYQGKMATRELLWQYANQRRYFVAASNQMEVLADVNSRLRVVTDLAERALAEIFLWSAHRFHREHEPPAAG